MGIVSSRSRRVVVDAHAHLYDSRFVRYGVFERKDPIFEALVGDYAALPRAYLLEDYLQATCSRKVEGIVWHEFIAEDPLEELQWAEKLASRSDVPIALVGLVDFAEPGLAHRLDLYGSIPKLTAVRQHLGWDSRDPLRRMAARPDFMSDGAWLAGLEQLKGRDLRCGLEVFSSQLEQLLEVVSAHPYVLFTVAVMGWPTGLGPDAFGRWRRDIKALSKCENTCASISAIECIFGLGWTEQQVRPWITAVVEAFGPKRCMFGSHMPIDALSHGFDRLYDAYESILASFSESERDSMLRTTALNWFRVRK